MKSKILLLLSLVISLHGLAQAPSIKVEIIEGALVKTIKSKIEKNASDLLNNLQRSYETNSDSIVFSDKEVSSNAKEGINAIWSSTKFYCLKQDIKERLLKTSSGYEVRNIPVQIDSLQEEIVLEFDKSGVITDMYFSVSQHQYKNNATNNIVIDETRKNIIRDFLETLKTAYMRKDADFINMVLSDKALIVVGKTVKQTNLSSFKISDTGKHTLYNQVGSSSYTKLTKEQYMSGLRKLFKANKNILVDYSDIEIIPHRKSGYESFYGVRLKQKWRSDSYSDLGILFFVIQFRENDNPLIWVRVWQDANTTSPSDQIGMGEILINPN